ncbi:glucose 1-dehydrogenase [Microbacterium sp. LRZ72]|uniref:SDR family NAD(P)-dependent oxidoreductase n=1 Tax=Microbacterium sp. LRZ72 TaxID=2942481 RepID=UPI0029B0AF51|nr:glucose 1-dehydrogenase [Microbacterium sp. LRZ72]MDX2378003.1 glucose 1-dehydrogenase [Microbacterium sp. LRZ72]
MNGKLQGKFAVVTGAGSGMGRAISARFAVEGATVAALDVNSEAAQETADIIESHGGQAISVRVDVSDAASVTRAAQLVTSRFERVDILANNAGVLDSYAPLLETSEELWDHVLNVDLKSLFLVTKALLPTMIDRGGGVVVNTSSIAGFVAGGGGIAYTSAKHGVIGFTKQLTADYGRKGIRANAICPGAVETEMTQSLFESGDAAVMESVRAVPAGRYAQPEEIANLALFLANDESAFVHGAAYLIDGGWTVR